ncbi:MAG: class I SAM-dependent methyltransferase [Alphaproteobacteria bacterium]
MVAADSHFAAIFDHLGAVLETAPLTYKAWHRSNFEQHAARYAADLKSLAALAPSGSAVLDVGAGPGHFTAALAEAGYRAVGVDVNPGRFADFSARFGLDVVGCDIERRPLPFADGAFRYVTFTEVYEHLRVDPFFALSEINRVLAHGGLLLLSTPNLYSAQNIARFVTGRSIGDPLVEFGKLRRIGHMGHVREYSNREMRRILAAHGFAVTATRFDHYNFSPTRRGRMARLVFAVLPRRFRTIQLLIARKVREARRLAPLGRADAT